MVGTRNIILIVLLTAGAIGSWYLARKNRIEEGAPPQEHTNRGYYLESARILGTGPDGSLLYEIRAQHAEQIDEDQIDFRDVSIQYSPESAVPWAVQADAATIRQDGRRIVLRGNVTAESHVGFSGRETEIRTQYLELDPDEYRAETEERVQIRIGSRSLTATGMLASLRDNTLNLKSNVSGKFVP